MRIILGTIAILLIIAGCESNNSFRTKAGVDSALQGKWDKVKIPITVQKEVFEFSSGTFMHHVYEKVGTQLVPSSDTGTYEIIANISTPYVVIHNLPYSNTYEGRWVIIQLDSKF